MEQQQKNRRKIAVLTSGGDAPGMNACLRSVVRKALACQLTVLGVNHGYDGLMNANWLELTNTHVSNIIQRGGTILKTARSERFRYKEGLKQAAQELDKAQVEALLAIGGNGTLSGLIELSHIWQGSVIGLPGTIDNDLFGTDDTIGYDTAINTALNAIDKIRDTADAHERTFIIEVMGREAGFIALSVGIAGGAEEILVPEQKTMLDAVSERIQHGLQRGKKSSIIVCAEGDDAGNAIELAEQLRQRTAQDYKICILGYVQRGGAPTARDRILASKLGAFAVDTFLEGHSGIMVGEVNNSLMHTPLQDAVHRSKPLDSYLLQLAHVIGS